ncbi:hypothetical protein HHI36_022339 [Cryptolaemus montrouzieri]|uniref:Peptidase A2 domain-containing protein n=1 Tax=Cryptolaemus montrouzieri TaxID=559131 RepID=A0ABD2MZP3_9CUCU
MKEVVSVFVQEVREGMRELNVTFSDLAEKVKNIDIRTRRLEKVHNIRNETLEKVADPRYATNRRVINNKIECLDRDNRSYILLWTELGGGNLTFSPNDRLHPTTFLKRLNKLFIDAGVPEAAKKGLALSCLRGSVSDWGLLKEDRRENTSGDSTVRNEDNPSDNSGNRSWRLENNNQSELLTSGKQEAADDDIVVPKVNLRICGENAEFDHVVLLDSGSDVCAISDGFFEEFKRHIRNIPVIPVSNTSIEVAAGAKKTLDSMSDFGRSVLNVRPNLTENSIKVPFVMGFREKDFCIQLFKRQDDNDQGIESSERKVKHNYSLSDFRDVCNKTNLDEENRKYFFELLCAYQSVFSECPGSVKGYVHDIELSKHEAINAISYTIPAIYRDDVRKQINVMIEWQIIRKQKTEYILPLVCVTKKDTSVRI